MLGKTDTTCLSCHRIHEPSTRDHRNRRTDESCLMCHDRQGPRWIEKEYVALSELCEVGADD